MTVNASHWENRLLSLAHEAQSSRPDPLPASASRGRGSNSLSAMEGLGSGEQLRVALEQCRQITSLHSRSFYLASRLLPVEKRRAVWALYTFCRISDDLVDQPGDNVEADLKRWRQRMLSSHPEADDWLALAWANTRHQFAIPPRYAEQLINGVTADLYHTRYETFADLTVYAYGVASTVGLMSMHIIGYSGQQAIAYAIKLGVALQITNILRDVAEDFAAGRVYLPQEELAAFQLTDADLATGVVDERWRAFMRFQIARNRRLYEEAWPGIAMLHPDGRLAIAAAAKFYEGILDDIEKRDYDVFSGRAHVSAWGKLRKLPGLWWQVARGG